MSQPEGRSCSSVWQYGSRYFCTSCQVAAGWTGCGGYCHSVSFQYFYFGSAEAPRHPWYIPDDLADLLLSFPVLGRAHPMPVCDVSSKGAFNIYQHTICSSHMLRHMISSCLMKKEMYFEKCLKVWMQTIARNNRHVLWRMNCWYRHLWRSIMIFKLIK